MVRWKGVFVLLLSRWLGSSEESSPFHYSRRDTFTDHGARTVYRIYRFCIMLRRRPAIHVLAPYMQLHDPMLPEETATVSPVFMLCLVSPVVIALSYLKTNLFGTTKNAREILKRGCIQ